MLRSQCVVGDMGDQKCIKLSSATWGTIRTNPDVCFQGVFLFEPNYRRLKAGAFLSPKTAVYFFFFKKGQCLEKKQESLKYLINIYLMSEWKFFPITSCKYKVRTLLANWISAASISDTRHLLTQIYRYIYSKPSVGACTH